ncbi:hypothetical protein D3C83_61250 [compost metagenome]
MTACISWARSITVSDCTPQAINRKRRMAQPKLAIRIWFRLNARIRRGSQMNRMISEITPSAHSQPTAFLE